MRDREVSRAHKGAVGGHFVRELLHDEGGEDLEEHAVGFGARPQGQDLLQEPRSDRAEEELAESPGGPREEGGVDVQCQCLALRPPGGGEVLDGLDELATAALVPRERALAPTWFLRLHCA